MSWVSPTPQVLPINYCYYLPTQVFLINSESVEKFNEIIILGGIITKEDDVTADIENEIRKDMQTIEKVRIMMEDKVHLLLNL